MSYLPLCYIQLQHSYFTTGYLQQADLKPTADTSRRLHNAQLLFKATKQGAMLLLDSSRRDIAAACCDSPLTLHFLLYSRDAQFGSYTEPALQQGQLLYCDNSTPLQQDEQLRLHSGAELNAADVISSTDPKLMALPELKQTPLPVLVLALTILRSDITQLTAAKVRHYLLSFGSRRRIWRYYLCGDSFTQPVQIRDLAPHGSTLSAPQFVQQPDVTLANGRSAKVFDSSAPLALAQQSLYRFALVSQDEQSEKILIKRLPVAAAGQCGLAVANGVPSNIAEIYLNY
ncbi:hypothetical protein WG68_17305 [Arsukibacterium ikkense]|uniref:Uncharacterized protein n=1 Tax=Arsukibacterium ikkense TaxID=336831 RepID=A0A0M2UZV0_9GAMM|nr:hypothetical protein [Arsukibacterium ikkense]KKO44077.1 hypothetical protein WG68_17305 [Arsukibacterium ikkense]